MKAVSRIAPPSCLDNDSPEVRAKKERLYETEEPWDGFLDKKSVRDELLKMFGGECAFCGKRLLSDNTDTQVDRFLPKKSRSKPESKLEPFKLLSLCWDNIILLCGNCNNKKGSFSPKSLEGKVFVERFMKDEGIAPQSAEVFEKNQVLNNCTDRLLDPSFDNPSEHILFIPCGFGMFKHITQIGKLMKEKIFIRSESSDIFFTELSDRMKEVVDNSPQPEQERDRIIKDSGYSFFRQHYYNYWLDIKEKRDNSAK